MHTSYFSFTQVLAQLIQGLQATQRAKASASGGEMATYQELSEIATDAGA